MTKKSSMFSLLLSLSILGGWCLQAAAKQLRTRNYQVEIVCAVANDCTYVELDRQTGKTMLRLKGKQVFQDCASRICPQIGYEFSDRRIPDIATPEGIVCLDPAPINYRYFVSTEGQLDLYQDGKLVFSEKGDWQERHQ
jgi:transcriptional antiterminator Rof (Rho-off)